MRRVKVLFRLVTRKKSDTTRAASKSARQARHALRLVVRRRTRSALAATGVAAAVAALLVAVAVAEGARRAVLNEIRRMGADVLMVTARQSRNVGNRARTGTSVRTLTMADAREIEVRVPGVRLITAQYGATLPVKAGGLARQTSISGVQASYAVMRQAPVERGRFFGDAEDVGAQRVAVFGWRVARDLFEDGEVIGRTIRINGIRFTVIGVLPERGLGLDAFNEDNVIFVPLTTARRRLFNADYIHRIFIQANTPEELDRVAQPVEALLRARHHIVLGREPDFRVQDQKRLVDARRNAAVRLMAFEMAVGAILLLAGAGGIFALQTMAVRERRAEIGTRRAIGATRWEIFAQFVTEALAVSVVGGAGGVLVGLSVAAVLRVTPPGALAPLAWLACVTACLLAAALPAWQAGRMPPAAAFRS